MLNRYDGLADRRRTVRTGAVRHEASAVRECRDRRWQADEYDRAALDRTMRDPIESRGDATAQVETYAERVCCARNAEEHDREKQRCPTETTEVAIGRPDRSNVAAHLSVCAEEKPS